MTDYKKQTIIELADEADMWNQLTKEAKYAVENIKIQYKVAKYIKQKFDEKYGLNWHCIVGKNFSSFVTYQSKHFAFFYQGQLGILLYKMG